MEAFAGAGQKYTSTRYLVPKPFPAGGIVVAANAGSDYLFVPDSNPDTAKAAVVEPAEPPAIRRDLRERQVRGGRGNAAHEPHQD